MKPSRENSLDILKCIATIIIIFHHYQQLTGAYFEGRINFDGGVFYWGYFVELFFLMSGYFSYKYIELIDKKNDFIRFIWKKYLRFAPMLFISGIACLGIDYVYSIKVNGGGFPYKFGIIVKSFLAIGRWWKEEILVNNPTWYISILMLCYIIFFFATYFSKKLKINPFIPYVFIICFAMYMRVDSVVDRSYPFYNEAIARGCSCFFLGLMYKPLEKKFNMIGIKNLVIEVLLIGLFVAGYMCEFWCMRGQLWYFLTFLLFPVLIFLFKNKVFCNLFSKDMFKNIGGIAYNAFMWHLFVLRGLVMMSNFTEINLDSEISMIFVTVVILVVGRISYLGIEKNIEKTISIWKNRGIDAQYCSNSNPGGY